MEIGKKQRAWGMCIVLAMMVFGWAACSDDEGGQVGNREMLIGQWQGVSYEYEETVDGEVVGSDREDFVDGTNRITATFLEDGTYKYEEVYLPNPGDEEPIIGSWSYSGNKLTIQEDHEAETFTVTKLTATDLEYEVRYTYTEEGETGESYEKYVFRKK